MAADTYKIASLPKKLGPGFTVSRVKKLLEEIGWEDKDNRGLLAVIDQATYEKLLARVQGGGLPERAEIQEAAKVPSAEQAPKTRRIGPARVRADAGVQDLGALPKEKAAPQRRAAPKTFFKKEDLEVKKLAKKAAEAAEAAPALPVAPAEAPEAAPEKKPKLKQPQPVTPAAKKPAAEKPAVQADEKEKAEEESKALKKKRGAVVAGPPPKAPVPVKKKIKEIVKLPDEAEPVRSRKRVFKIKGGLQQHLPAAAKTIPTLKITGDMSVRDISMKTGVKVGDIISFLLKDLNVLANINHVVSEDEVQLVADHFGIPYEVKHEEAPEDVLEMFDRVSAGNLVPRPPVVTVMGHVDHGKTKLLDRIRHTNVVAQESGGITQHIGAYQIVYKNKQITFLDTPGHAAFTQMRARGSQVTDVVVLVVACDDGVKPQTKEAVEHAKAANVPIIVALNKNDLPSANAERTMSQVAELGLVPEEWGGDTIFVKISALTGENIEELLDMILLQAELLDLKADPKAPAYGVVIESQITTGQGVIATVLVMQGTFRRGQYLVCGTSGGRIKRMEDEWAKSVDEALPSRPVRLIGLDFLPSNGDKIFAFINKRQAGEIIETRKDRERLELQRTPMIKASLEDFYSRLEKGEVKDLNVVLKCDVGGSEEAILSELGRINVEGTKVHVLSHGVGQINENDIMLASASEAIVLGFRTTLTSGAKRLVEQEKVDVRMYDIIYQMSEDIQKAMLGLLEPIFEEFEFGKVEIREIFRTTKDNVICGGYVLDGKAERGKKFRLRRGTDVLFEGSLRSLRRFKDDVREVASGYECGFVIEGTSDVEPGDILHLYDVKEVPRF
ncbi:MAG: translation initiation factor IF-2 [bacterium]|jgi:translation initiation factor IF-2